MKSRQKGSSIAVIGSILPVIGGIILGVLQYCWINQAARIEKEASIVT